MRKSKYAWMKSQSLIQLMRLAARHANTETGQAALAYAVDELLVVEVEHRMITAQQYLGYASASPTVYAGEGGAPTGERSSLIEVAADRLNRTNPWRPLALEMLAQMSDRQKRAAVITAFLIPQAGNGPRSLQMLPTHEAVEPANQRRIYQVLGWPPGGPLMFNSGTGISKAASVAKKKMREALLDKLVAAAMV